MTSLQISKKITLFFSVCMITSMGNAKSIETIVCPSVEKIRQAAPLINFATLPFPKRNEHAYIASSSQTGFQDNNINWGILVGVDANSQEEAIAKAKTVTAQVTTKNFENPMEMPDFGYSCYYTNTNNFNDFVLAINIKLGA